MLHLYGFEDIKPCATPMDPHMKLSKADCPTTVKEFAEMIGWVIELCIWRYLHRHYLCCCNPIKVP
jgi:hypothetical protein